LVTTPKEWYNYDDGNAKIIPIFFDKGEKNEKSYLFMA
jgi:hypothetical protein